MSKNDGGPAFPNSMYVNQGMSRRDWFAGMALSGLVSRAYRGISFTAEESFRLADAMLAESNKEKIRAPTRPTAPLDE